MDPRHLTDFPPGFFARDDETDDADFYAFDRLVTHIDDGAIEAVGAVYEELGLTGEGSGPVLDICSSWISHFPTKPERLVITGMNAAELAANEMADEWVVKDLNVEPVLPFDDEVFAAVTCAVSVDYLNRPLDVFAEVARVLRPGGVFVCTFSNRCFPTKAIRGWLANNDRGRVQIVGRYFDLTDGFDPPVGEHRNNGAIGDPLYAVWATRSS
ncbi:MAG: methyltransferase domain-containing protein [Actinomycetota bacterium]